MNRITLTVAKAVTISVLLSVAAYGIGVATKTPIEAPRPAEHADPPQPQYDGWGVQFSGTCVEVYDGDTITVQPAPRLYRLRLLDCWCAEVRGGTPEQKRLGLAARDYLKELLKDRQVVVQVPIDPSKRFGKSMTFDRLLAHCWYQDDAGKWVNVAKKMRDAGHAYATKKEQQEAQGK